MSFSAPAQHDPNAAPPTAASPATAHFPDLHSLAVDVVHDLQALAVGLQHAGAADAAVHQVTGMAQTIGNVAHTLSQSPPIPNPAHQDAQAASSPNAAPPSSGPAPAQPGGAPQPSSAHADLASAIAGIHKASVNALNAPQQ